MYGDYDKHRELGHFIGAIRIANFLPVEEFKKNVGAMIDDIHATPAASGFERVLVPGEKEYVTQLQYEKEGIPVPSEILKELQASAEGLGLPVPFSGA